MHTPPPPAPLPLRVTASRISGYLRTPALAPGTEVCALLDEFGAGTDLSDVQTRALRMGDGWKVIGTKLPAHLSPGTRWGLVLARTEPDSTGYDGLTCFLCDLTALGVHVTTVRPRTEVLLDRVDLPERHRVGSVGAGWPVLLDLAGGPTGAGDVRGWPFHA